MGMTRDEAQARFKRGEEGKLHALINNYLLMKGIYFRHDRMDKRTTCRKGTPDFACCYNGYAIFLECKADGETLSEEQAKEANRIQANGGKYAVCYSLSDAIRTLNVLDQNKTIEGTTTNDHPRDYQT
jgi:type I site-specific restriction-modification system R (restriction) subunit